MRLWLGFGALVVLVIVGVGAVVSSEKKETQARLEKTLASYRSALPSGTTREQVENYLQQHSMSFVKTPGAISDRADLGQEPRNLFCQPWNVSLEFQFKASEPPLDAAHSSDVLTGIGLHREGVCF